MLEQESISTKLEKKKKSNNSKADRIKVNGVRTGERKKNNTISQKEQQQQQRREAGNNNRRPTACEFQNKTKR